MLVLAQVHVDPRDEGAAECIVEQLERNLVGVGLRCDQLAGEDVRLIRSRPVEHVHGLPRAAGDLDQLLHRGVARLPRCERFLQLRRQFRHGDVTHGDDRPMVRLEPGTMEGDEIVARHRLYRRLGSTAGERLTVCVASTVEQERQHAQPHRERLHLLLLDRRQRVLLDAIEIALRKRWMEDDVREQRQRRVELVLERRDGEPVDVEARVGVQVDA